MSPGDKQQMPRQAGGEPVTPVALRLFVEMLAERERTGIAEYGRSLHTNNGRDAVVDALQEQIDGFQYLVQTKMEREREHRILRAWVTALDGCRANTVDTIARKDYLLAVAELEALARELLP